MERLTFFENGRWWIRMDGTKYAGFPEVERLAAYEDAMPLERAQELAQADKDGRLVVLPIPVGAGKVAYGLTDSDDGQQYIVTIECDYLERLEIWDNPGHEAVIEADGWEIREPDIGKIVFLTREEAEAALKKREEDNETD